MKLLKRIKWAITLRFLQVEAALHRVDWYLAANRGEMALAATSESLAAECDRKAIVIRINLAYGVL